MNDWLTLANLVALLTSVSINVWLFMATRSDARWAKMQGCIDTIGANALAASQLNDRRLSVVETRLEGMPTHTDLTQVVGRLSGISSQVSGIEERSRSTQHAVTRIEKFLMEKRG